MVLGFRMVVGGTCIAQSRYALRRLDGIAAFECTNLGSARLQLRGCLLPAKADQGVAREAPNLADLDTWQLTGAGHPLDSLVVKTQQLPGAARVENQRELGWI